MLMNASSQIQNTSEDTNRKDFEDTKSRIERVKQLINVVIGDQGNYKKRNPSSVEK